MKQGIALSLLSAVLFSTLYYYSTLLAPLNGEEIFAWRAVLAVPALALLIGQTRGWPEVRRLWVSLRRSPLRAVALVVCAVLIGLQLWLFSWAPLHQKALDVAQGYFLMPLMMVLVGRVFYKERLSRLQTAAVVFAAIGVAHELLRVNAFSWATALVMFGYPPYFMLRRALRYGSLVALWVDMLILTPVALVILIAHGGILGPLFAAPRLWGLVPLLGLLSSAALACYMSASRRLPLSLFGILGYVEPALLFWVAVLLLDEGMAPGALWTYVPIWTAVGLIVVDGARAWRGEQRLKWNEKKA
jgi:chloramphenicol-sensitive protein RarD